MNMDDKDLKPEPEKQTKELSEQVAKLQRTVVGGLVFLVVFAFVVAPLPAGIATGAVILCWVLQPPARRLFEPRPRNES